MLSPDQEMTNGNCREGIIVPLMPFLTNEQKYDFPAVERQIENYISSGIAGIFALTTCGQSASFSLEENQDLASLVAEVAQGRVPVYVGIGRTKGEKSYSGKMLEHAQKISAQAAVALCLDMSPDEQVSYFRKLNNSRFPIIAYSLGSQQKQLKKVEEILSLDNVIGIKATIDTREKENERYFQKIVAFGKPVFMGEDAFLYDGLEMGAKGGVNAVANLIPEELVRMYKLYSRGNKEEALVIQKLINEKLLSVLYYGKYSREEPIDAASALQCAMFLKSGFGSPVMKNPKPTYFEDDQEVVRKALLDLQTLTPNLPF